MSRITEHDGRLIAALQAGLPLVERPYAEIARRAGWTEPDVIARLREWRAAGVLRRICAYVRHREAGFTANGMVVCDVPEDRVNDVGRRLAECPMVTHCYARSRTPAFPFRLYAMMHGRSREQVVREAGRLARENHIDAHRVLFSKRELKRSTPRLFDDAPS